MPLPLRVRVAPLSTSSVAPSAKFSGMFAFVLGPTRLYEPPWTVSEVIESVLEWYVLGMVIVWAVPVLGKVKSAVPDRRRGQPALPVVFRTKVSVPSRSSPREGC